MHSEERVVVAVIGHVPVCIGSRNGSGGDFSQLLDQLERALEAIQNSVELHPHLKSQRPPRVAVWGDRWSPGILEVVRMLLGLEHVHDVGAKRLVGLYAVRSGRIAHAPNENSLVVRCTSTPFFKSALMNFVAVEKSA